VRVPRDVVETRGGTIEFTGRRDGASDLCWCVALFEAPALTPRRSYAAASRSNWFGTSIAGTSTRRFATVSII
jgi:hypothetical protein